MNDEENIRTRLLWIDELTKQNTISDVYWVGDSADERRVLDNLRAGRLDWKAGQNNARRGLLALARGQIDYARASLIEAQANVIHALLKIAKWKDLEQLITDAGLRGRHKTTEERNMEWAIAVGEQESRGLTFKAARDAVKKARPDLLEAIGGKKTDAAIRKACNEGFKLLAEKSCN